MTDPKDNHSGSFAQAFVPGLILGLVIGALAGAFLPDLFSGPSIPAPTGEPGPAYEDRDRLEGAAPITPEEAEEIVEPADPQAIPGGVPTDPQPLPTDPDPADPADQPDQP
jgi:hypothetical protein